MGFAEILPIEEKPEPSLPGLVPNRDECLTTEQMKALNLFAMGMSWKRIQEEMDMPTNHQLRNWRKGGAFKVAMIEISNEAVEQAKLSMKAAIPKLVDKMIELADEGNINAIIDTLNRVLGDPKLQQNQQQQNQNIAIQVNLAAHRDSE